MKNTVNAILENLRLNETKSINLGNGSTAYQYNGSYFIKKGNEKREISFDQYDKLRSKDVGFQDNKSSKSNYDEYEEKDFKLTYDKENDKYTMRTPYQIDYMSGEEGREFIDSKTKDNTRVPDIEDIPLNGREKYFAVDGTSYRVRRFQDTQGFLNTKVIGKPGYQLISKDEGESWTLKGNNSSYDHDGEKFKGDLKSAIKYFDKFK